MNFFNLKEPRYLRIFLAGLTSIAMVGLFYYFYVTDPFPAGVTDIVTGGMIVLAAFGAALIGTLVWRQYGRNTPPKILWLHFSLALWGWALAEAFWLYEYAVNGNYILGPADVLWVVSYLFFIAALYSQYALIYRPSRWTGVAYLTLGVLAVGVFTYLNALWLADSNAQALSLETLVNAFYAVGDIALAGASLWLAFTFRNGALGRPWIGLIVFAFSDLLYAWLETSGLYAWSIAEGNILTTLTDVTYLAAYLVIAFGCYLQLILLKYGPRVKP